MWRWATVERLAPIQTVVKKVEMEETVPSLL